MARLSLLLIIFVSSTACQTTRPIGWDNQTLEPRPYAAQLNDWTRHEVSYHQIESRLFVHATCVSPTFASVYARENADRANMAASEAIALREKLVKEARTELKFIVSVATGDPYWNDMGGSKATLRASLTVDERLEMIKPVTVERLTPKQQADLRPFFEYLTPLSQAYVVTFPPFKGGKRLNLRIGGPPGVVELSWNLSR
ncbi:MAG: hypothetical protein VX589_00420 [Myxococcota bacterium]|nr:hypothetical protein [Myxococcota bacterium]